MIDEEFQFHFLFSAITHFIIKEAGAKIVMGMNHSPIAPFFPELRPATRVNGADGFSKLLVSNYKGRHYLCV